MPSNENDVTDQSPWIPLLSKEPAKDEVFWAWDNQLERIIKGMKWFDGDIQDWGSETDPWSGDFAFWMRPEAKIDTIASPYSYNYQ